MTYHNCLHDFLGFRLLVLKSNTVLMFYTAKLVKTSKFALTASQIRGAAFLTKTGQGYGVRARYLDWLLSLIKQKQVIVAHSKRDTSHPNNSQCTIKNYFDAVI